MRVRPDVARAMDDFGRRVAEIRRTKGWTQAALAERWGVGVDFVKRTERGRQNFTLSAMVLLASVLRVKHGELLFEPQSRAKRRPGRPKKSA